MNCNILVTLLCTISILLRLYPYDSTAIIAFQATDNIRFTNPHPTVDSLHLVADRSKLSHLSLAPRGSPPARVLLSWLMLTSGDIEINPGPTEYSCTRCSQAVKDSHCAIYCDICGNWTHADCCGISRLKYLELERQGDSWEWYCPSCCQAAQPFANSSTISSDPGSLHSPDMSLNTTSNASMHSAPSNQLVCRLYNARSVMNKRDDLSALLEFDKPDIVAITETWLSDEIGVAELVNNDYCVFRRDRNRHGGGVMLLVNNNIQTTRRIDLEDATTELLWIELSHSKGRTLLGVFYRPPSSDLEYLRNLQNSLSKIPDSHNITLCGDFNVPNVNWNTNVPITPSQVATLLTDITLHSSLSQLVPDTTKA